MADELIEGSATGTGEPVDTGSATATGEPSGVGTKSGEPTGSEGLRYDNMTPEELHKSYKNLQSEYTKVNQAVKKLDSYGGVDQITQWANYLQTNPRFADWAKQEMERAAYGIPGGEQLDDETKKALELVRNVSREEANRLLQDAMKAKVEPLAEKYKAQLLERNFATMDEKYEGWRELQETMAELGEQLPPDKQDNPTFEDLEDLYFKALRTSGKFENYAAKIYEKKLAAMKSKSTEKPPSAAPNASPQQFKSIAAAFEYAKKQAGLR